jgi:hypothetical protein
MVAPEQLPHLRTQRLFRPRKARAVRGRRSTDNHLKRDGRWRLITLQIQVLPSEFEPSPWTPRSSTPLSARYQLAPDVVYVVTRAGNWLMGERVDGSALKRGQAPIWI